VIAGVGAALAAATLSLTNLGSTPSAAATVRAAMTAANQSASGRAHMTVDATIGDQHAVNAIDIEWNGADESYRMTEHDAVTYQFRLIADVGYQSDRNQPAWRVLNDVRELDDLKSQLNNAADGERLAVLSPDLHFARQGSETIGGNQLTRYAATGDLSILDTQHSGFLFGTNGAPGAHTTALTVWLDDTKTVRRVQIAFSGSDNGVPVLATATTELTDLGAPITISKPEVGAQ
jgi:hypothetical protein